MKKIKLTQGKVAIIDDEDYELVSQHMWCADKGRHTFYAITQVMLSNGKQSNLRMHRLILGLKRGDSRHCDHINGNGSDNRRSNLRICTQQQNSRNRRPNESSASLYKGLTWNKKHQKWMTAIMVDGNLVHLGYFTNEADAAYMYDRVALMEYGEFARTNFPKKSYAVKDYLTVSEAISLREKLALEKKSSRFSGVDWYKHSKKWRSRIRINGKEICLGRFASEIDAAKAYNKSVIDNELNKKLNNLEDK